MQYCKIYVFIALINFSCTEVYFEKSQPVEVQKSVGFPDEILGSYYTDKDTITITPKAYLEPKIFQKTIPLKKLENNSRITLKDGLLYNKEFPNNKGVRYTIKNDTLRYHAKFNVPKTLSENLILKEHGKYLYLSEKEKKYWHVYLIKALANGNLKIYTIGNFISEDENTRKLKYDGVINDFFPITNFKKMDSSTYLINPTLKELEKLIKKGLFVEFMELKKVKELNK